MKLSVVTVVYNACNTIERTFNSVISQSFKDLEYVVIDGGSTDGTLDFLNKNRKNISILISEKDNGIYDAMNKSCNLCKGEWIVFMNAGDMFASNDILEKLFSADLDLHTTDVIYGDAYNCNGEDVFITKAEPLSIIKYRLPFCHQSVYVKKELLIEYKFNTNYRFVADYDLFKRLYNDGKKFFYFETPLSRYYSEGGLTNRNIINVFKEESYISGIRDIRWLVRYCHVYISSILHQILPKFMETTIRLLCSKKVETL